jgi:hypothetical protein
MEKWLPYNRFDEKSLGLSFGGDAPVDFENRNAQKYEMYIRFPGLFHFFAPFSPSFRKNKKNRIDKTRICVFCLKEKSKEEKNAKTNEEQPHQQPKQYAGTHNHVWIVGFL